MDLITALKKQEGRQRTVNVALVSYSIEDTLQALKAARKLRNKGYRVAIVDPNVKPEDEVAEEDQDIFFANTIHRVKMGIDFLGVYSSPTRFMQQERIEFLPSAIRHVFFLDSENPTEVNEIYNIAEICALLNANPHIYRGRDISDTIRHVTIVK